MNLQPPLQDPLSQNIFIIPQINEKIQSHVKCHEGLVNLLANTLESRLRHSQEFDKLLKDSKITSTDEETEPMVGKFINLLKREASETEDYLNHLTTQVWPEADRRIMSIIKSLKVFRTQNESDSLKVQALNKQAQKALETYKKKYQQLNQMKEKYIQETLKGSHFETPAKMALKIEGLQQKQYRISRQQYYSKAQIARKAAKDYEVKSLHIKEFLQVKKLETLQIVSNFLQVVVAHKTTLAKKQLEVYSGIAERLQEEIKNCQNRPINFDQKEILVPTCQDHNYMDKLYRTVKNQGTRPPLKEIIKLDFELEDIDARSSDQTMSLDQSFHQIQTINSPVDQQTVSSIMSHCRAVFRRECPFNQDTLDELSSMLKNSWHRRRILHFCLEELRMDDENLIPAEKVPYVKELVDRYLRDCMAQADFYNLQRFLSLSYFFKAELGGNQPPLDLIQLFDSHLIWTDLELWKTIFLFLCYYHLQIYAWKNSNVDKKKGLWLLKGWNDCQGGDSTSSFNIAESNLLYCMSMMKNFDFPEKTFQQIKAHYLKLLRELNCRNIFKA